MVEGVPQLSLEGSFRLSIKSKEPFFTSTTLFCSPWEVTLELLSTTTISFQTIAV
jgi:hypothetical protein